MIRFRTSVLVSGAIATLLAGCAPMIPGMPGSRPPPQAELTPEQSHRLAEAMLRRLEQSPAPMQAAATHTKSATTAVLTEVELARQLSAFPPLSTGVVIEGRRDGFAVDGARYIDPEGAIVRYGADPSSGDVTYMAQTDQDSFVLKTVRVADAQAPITIATATRRHGLWHVETVTGKTLRGTRLIPLSRGVLVGRDNTGFVYLAGEGTRSFAAPEAFDLAGFQNGDIAGTDYVLLERRQEPTQGGALGETLSALAALGNALGVSRKEDYVLYAMSTGKMHPLDIAADGKSTGLYSQCRQKNVALRLCDRVDFVESLYDAQGMPNFSHYYWRVSWYKTAHGPIAIAQESGLKDITVTDLATGRKATALNRMLGIAGFTSSQGTDGRVSIVAQMGFSKEKVEDASALLFGAKAEIHTK